ncbi:MAG: glutamyl-tRNA reductase [Methanolinea sp.]|nr:glutamyl-tRNA reductase [Methanolinea sp.]
MREDSPEMLLAPLAIAGMSHHTSTVNVLESHRFPDELAFLSRARTRFKGVMILQTCNRVEIFVHGESSALAALMKEEGREQFFLYTGVDALRHLLELACGIDSMIVGEDQILGQLKKALQQSGQAGCSSPVLDLCVNKAVHVGVEARTRTHINRGAVSIGSAAVLLAEEQLGTLQGRHILVIGSGEMGMLVAQALAAKELTAIYVANRTFKRAEILADKIGGKAVRLNDLPRYLALSDVVISCTSAPHPVVHCHEIEEAMKARSWPLDNRPRPLILIDIANPRDVEEGVEEIPGVCLFSIDSLRQINERTMETRMSEAERVREFLENELCQAVRLLNSRAADDTLGILHTWAESIRNRERDKALARLGARDEKTREIVDDLSRVLISKILADVTVSIRLCAEKGDLEAAESLVAAITKGEKLCSQREE